MPSDMSDYCRYNKLWAGEPIKIAKGRFLLVQNWRGGIMKMHENHQKIKVGFSSNFNRSGWSPAE